MNKKKLLKLINSKMDKKKELVERAKTCEDVQELRSINSEMDNLNNDIDELRSLYDSMPEDEENDEEIEGEVETRGTVKIPKGKLNVMAAYGIRSDIVNDTDLEQRQAFMSYVLKGEKQEQRADATTMVSDLGVAIPNTIVNKIVEKLKSYGEIYSRITQSNIKGGVQVPTSSIKPTATWQNEGTVADKKKKEIDGYVSFNYYKLQCRIAVSLEADTVSLSVFEQTVTDNIYEAMIIALETAVINGTGSKQPLGITKDNKITTSQKVSVTAEELKSWEKWSKIFSKVPKAKRSGTVLILNDETWEGDILGMVDSNGQPIARVNIGLNGEDRPVFKGKEVITVEDSLPTFEAAASGDVFGILVNLKDYTINSNMQMTVKRYFDENTDEWITKATLIADGKLIDTQGVVLLTKSTSTGA